MIEQVLQLSWWTLFTFGFKLITALAAVTIILRIVLAIASACAEYLDG